MTMTITNIEEARRSPVTVVERRLAEIEDRMKEIKDQQAILQKEMNEIFHERGDLQSALSSLKKLMGREQ